MQTSMVGDVGSAETEPRPHRWSLRGSTPAFTTHIAPTQTVGPSGAPAPLVLGCTSWAVRNHASISGVPSREY